jgi:hypothetical protein
MSPALNWYHSKIKLSNTTSGTKSTKSEWYKNPTYITLLAIDLEVNGRAIAQAVSRRPLTAEATVLSRVSPFGICGGQSDTGTGFPPEYFGFPCQFHSTGRKTKKLIIFITGLHNKP